MTARLSAVVLVKCNGVACSCSVTVPVATSLLAVPAAMSLTVSNHLVVNDLGDLVDTYERVRRSLREQGWSSPAVGVTGLDFCPSCSRERNP